MDWAAEYAAVRPECVRFARKLEIILRELLRENSISYIQIERRAKTVRSFCEKIGRKENKYSDPLTEIKDLTGLRIVTYYLEDVERVHDMLDGPFLVDVKHSVRKADELEPDRFGYLSDHVVMRLGPALASRSEWQEFTKSVAEVQIRTVLQHAWAAIDHKLDYKSEHDIPVAVKRNLFRLSALLELADEQFEAARHAATEVARRYAEQLAEGELSAVQLDIASLEAYFASSGLRDRWQEIAVQEGLGEHDWKSQAARETLSQDRSDLLSALRLIGVETLDGLETFLRSAEKWAPGALRHIGERWAEVNAEKLCPTPDSVLTILALCSIEGGSSKASEIYGRDVSDAIASFSMS